MITVRESVVTILTRGVRRLRCRTAYVKGGICEKYKINIF